MLLFGEGTTHPESFYVKILYEKLQLCLLNPFTWKTVTSSEGLLGFRHICLCIIHMARNNMATFKYFNLGPEIYVKDLF